jgi:hypothetical protein
MSEFYHSVVGMENAKQPKTIVKHRRLEVNPTTSVAWMRRLSGHAMLAGKPPLGILG